MRIGDASKKTGLGIHTIRYYEKQGLIRKPEKDGSGHRIYSSKDIEILDWISCMKNSGMPLSKIRTYSQALYSDDRSICLDILTEHLSKLNEQHLNLLHYIDVTKKKISSLSKTPKKALT